MEITKKPHLVAFAGNPMRYLLSQSGSVGGGGGGGDPTDTLSIVKITFTGSDTTEDHSVDVTFLGSTRTLILKEKPDSANHLPVAGQDMSPSVWAGVIYRYLLDDVQLNSLYDITLDDDEITLTAKSPGEDYDWSSGNNTITGVAITMAQNGALGTITDVEGVLMQVLKNGTIKIGEDYKPVTADGTVEFDIQEYLFAYLMTLPPPRFALSAAQYNRNVYTDFFLKYRTIFCDRVNGAYLPRTYSDPDNIFCYGIPGGLNREDLVENNAGNVDWFALEDTQKKFLTWAPPSRITDKDETHSLFFAIQTPSYSSVQMKCIIVTTEGSMAPISMTPDLLVQYWTVMEFMAGYAQLDLDTLSSHRQVISWQLFLVDDKDNIVSDIREFVLDQNYYENVRYFRFRNSWGAYDSLRCTGVTESAIEHEREEVTYISEETETTFNSPGNYTKIKEAQNFKTNSGWLQRDFMTFLRDFMLSGDIFEVVDGKLLKCLLTSKKTTMFKDLNYNYSLGFEYKRAWDDFFFQTSE